MGTFVIVSAFSNWIRTRGGVHAATLKVCVIPPANRLIIVQSYSTGVCRPSRHRFELGVSRDARAVCMASNGFVPAHRKNRLWWWLLPRIDEDSPAERLVTMICSYCEAHKASSGFLVKHIPLRCILVNVTHKVFASIYFRPGPVRIVRHADLVGFHPLRIVTSPFGFYTDDRLHLSGIDLNPRVAGIAVRTPGIPAVQPGLLTPIGSERRGIG
jgi:hypothetical protein